MGQWCLGLNLSTIRGEIRVHSEGCPRRSVWLWEDLGSVQGISSWLCYPLVLSCGARAESPLQRRERRTLEYNSSRLAGIRVRDIVCFAPVAVTYRKHRDGWRPSALARLHAWFPSRDTRCDLIRCELSTLSSKTALHSTPWCVKSLGFCYRSKRRGREGEEVNLCRPMMKVYR